MRRLLGKIKISKSSYYSFNENKEEFDYADFIVIKKYFIKGKEKLGIRQLKMDIERKEGLIFNEKKIARIKRKYGLETKIRRRNTHRDFKKKLQEHEICPNFLEQNFNTTKPDQIYSTDITEVKYNNKKAYIAAVKDLCTKEIVASTVSNRIDIALTDNTIKKAITRLPPEVREQLIVHSDQGMHFTHFSYRNYLSEQGVLQSMSRKGNCLDNAPIESFFGHMKDHLELEHCKNLEDVKKEVTKVIRFYNYDRPQLDLKKMPPIEYRRHLNF